MSKLVVFSPDHATARRRFREAVLRLGWSLESHSIGAVGPDGEELAFDVGCSREGDPEKVLVVSSGVHGVEGFFGSAVQVALLEQWASSSPPPIQCVFLHGLNPFGFAWLRRFDEHNVDPNRNFLLAGEAFEGVDEGYARHDAFLNPRRPPARWEPFTLKALWLIARYGMPALRQAVAGGQYRYPRGLFFGGAGPSRMQKLLGENLPRWLKGSQRVVHLDFHTGLGPWGGCKLLIDYPLKERQRGWLTEWFGADSFEACESRDISYDAKGGFGRWCVSRGLAPEYLFACAEFGTYGPVQVLAGLRAENQAHHWGSPVAASTLRAKARLKELFCPASEAWRSQVIERSLELVGRAQRGLLAADPGGIEPVLPKSSG
ncbi:MAG: DUF2817 domain-containing protein [Planctomyces sp.]|nr:DUF2817 domain-containing protein [Planctomyces sp.]